MLGPRAWVARRLIYIRTILCYWSLQRNITTHLVIRNRWCAAYQPKPLLCLCRLRRKCIQWSCQGSGTADCYSDVRRRYNECSRHLSQTPQYHSHRISRNRSYDEIKNGLLTPYRNERNVRAFPDGQVASHTLLRCGTCIHPTKSCWQHTARMDILCTFDKCRSALTRWTLWSSKHCVSLLSNVLLSTSLHWCTEVRAMQYALTTPYPFFASP